MELGDTNRSRTWSRNWERPKGKLAGWLQDGRESGKISKQVAEGILEKSKKYNNLAEKQKEKVSQHTEKVIRKIAHFSIYTAVGFLLIGLLSTYKLKNKWRIIITVIIGVLYAVSDEFHQSFSPGRTPMVTDVYIDTLGIILGILILLLIKEVYNKFNAKHKYKNNKTWNCKIFYIKNLN